MKNRKSHVHRVEGGPVKTFANPSCDEMMEDVIGTKVLYDWLYHNEEEDYYLNLNVSDSLPHFSQEEALFVDF